MEHPISDEMLDNLQKLDQYLQTRFKLAFGNRIMKQMYDFIPVYVACGGTELGAMDYIIARKVLKKFESMNVSFVRDEIQQKYFDRVKEGRILFPEYICREEPWQSQLHAVLIEICERFEKGEKAYELLIKAKLYEVWYLLYTHAALTEGAAGGARDSRAVMIKEVIAYIQAHYEEHIGIPELAERFHVSEGHLCRMFKGMTQKSVVEYLNYYRISVSVELLNMGEHDIGQIAGMTGFNNISYFNRMFRRFMRMTPSEYRKLQE